MSTSAMARVDAVHAEPGTARVIFVMPFPPTPDFRRNFFVRELDAAGLRAEYWDIAAVMRYDMRFASDREGLIYRRIDSIALLEREVMSTDPRATVFVLQLTRGVDSYRVYRVFSRAGRIVTFFGRGYLPSPAPERDPRVLLRKLLRPGSARSIAFSAAFRLLRGRLPFIRPYDLVFTAGLAAERRHVRDAARIAPVHHFDVDAAHAADARHSPAAAPCVVFIDDYLPYHPDFETFGSETVEPTSYYGAMNRFFDAVERQYGIPVVIAAHPKASYDENPFEGRSIITGATSALVKRATLVLAHASTAISLAVIHRRPLCLTYTPEISRVHPFLFNSMLMTAEMLGCPIVDCTTDEGALAGRAIVSEERYAEYHQEYLSVADPRRTSAEIVVEELLALVGPSRPAEAASESRLADETLQIGVE